MKMKAAVDLRVVTKLKRKQRTSNYTLPTDWVCLLIYFSKIS